jgi:hypothetical protein
LHRISWDPYNELEDLFCKPRNASKNIAALFCLIMLLSMARLPLD